MITEGKARLNVKTEKTVSRKLSVFYNPAMKLNRDVSVLLLGSLENREMRIADPLAASGVRSIRFLLELDKPKVKKVFVNDCSSAAVRSIRRNLALNDLSRSRKVWVSGDDAGVFLLQNGPFDYVDVDPFGSPVAFLDPASRSLSGRGILAVTATDTAALSGSAPRACMRKYWASSLRGWMMHEFGLRILIRRAQLAAASHEKALVPVYSYAKMHYMRVFFRCSGKVGEVDRVLGQHGHVMVCDGCFSAGVVSGGSGECCGRKASAAGPMWTGPLWDSSLAGSIAEAGSGSESEGFLRTVSDEAEVGSFGFHDTHFLCRKLRISVPSLGLVISSLKRKGFEAARTHLSGNGIRSNADVSDVVKILRRI